MARTALTITNAPDGYAQSGQTITFEAGDPVNGNSFVSTGKEILLARNTDTIELTVLRLP